MTCCCAAVLPKCRDNTCYGPSNAVQMHAFCPFGRQGDILHRRSDYCVMHGVFANFPPIPTNARYCPAMKTPHPRVTMPRPRSNKGHCRSLKEFPFKLSVRERQFSNQDERERRKRSPFLDFTDCVTLIQSCRVASSFCGRGLASLASCETMTSLFASGTSRTSARHHLLQRTNPCPVIARHLLCNVTDP